MRNVRGVLAGVWRSGVFWWLTLVVLAQLALAVAVWLGDFFVGFQGVRSIAEGQAGDAAITVVLFYTVAAIPWGLTLAMMMGLFNPISQTLAEPEGSPHGFKWSLKQALRQGPRLLLVGVGCSLFATALGLVSDFSQTGRAIALLVGLATLLAAVPFAALPWFVATRLGIFAALKRSVVFFLRHWLCFGAFYVLLVVLALGCGCGAFLGGIAPFVGELFESGMLILFGVPAWLLYVALMSTLDTNSVG
jgi:hypothetical protein